MKPQRSIHVTLVVLAVGLLLAGCGGSDSGDPFVNCGNGRLDSGEQCDDGNTEDNDACLSTCVRAICGDGFVNLASETCDGLNFASCANPQTNNRTDQCDCSDFGQAGGNSLRCTAACQIDTSACGVPLPSTPTPAATATATATATPVPCGDGVITAGETCDTCPQDCAVLPCTAAPAGPTVAVTLTIPDGQSVTGVTVLVGYHSSVVSLPGSGAETSVSGRVKNRPSNAIPGINDLDYALRVVLARSSPLPAGRLFTIDFDACSGGPAATAAEFGCTVEGCANANGTVDGCMCSVSIEE